MISQIFETFINGYKNYANYLWHEIKNPNWGNYFYWLIGVSLFFFILELVVPWRKNQKEIRKDFWLDLFYVFFNFFLFSLIIYNAASDVVVQLFNNFFISAFDFDLQAMNPLRQMPMWSILIIGFLVRDFVQWWIHRLLHSSKFLWEFHKVHHSVEEMGFAAHLRYHWMENIVYRTLEYLPLALLGIGLYDFFIIHIFTLSIGHYNHSNISIKGHITAAFLGALIGIVIATSSFDVDLFETQVLWQQVLIIATSAVVFSIALGPFMKLLFNSPEMHIWHHSYELPDDKPKGINFGISLAIWDFIFGTAHIPHNGRDIRLGFPKIEQFPKTFGAQIVHGFQSENKK